MVFNSYEFIVFFLPISLLLFYFLYGVRKEKLLVLALLGMSLLFYAFHSPQFLLLLMMEILINYFFYRILLVKQQFSYRQLLLMVGVAMNLVVLAYFKYYNFFIDNANLLFHTNYSIGNIVLPVGISFITFQQIAFLVDTYKGKSKQYGLMEYALFIMFFPHILSGPIIVQEEFFPELHLKREHIDWKRISEGVYFFAMGLGKKVLVADVLAKAVNWGYSNTLELNTCSTIFIVVAYTMQIYFDFSGYSDMAIGISRMLQLNLPINFNSPYKACRISEFWDRWHITLTNFFTRYLYIPLGGSRKGILRTYFNIMVVFVCSGFWHGASWTFILWGMIHGIFMVVDKKFNSTIEKIPPIINQVVVFILVNFTWILFRAGSFTILKQIITAMFRFDAGGYGLNENIVNCFIPVLWKGRMENLFPNWLFAIGMLVVAMLITLFGRNSQERVEKMKYNIGTAAWVLFLLVYSLISLSGMNTFIYVLF